MTPENFCFWIQGFFELKEETGLTERQEQVIKDHLQLVFSKETPERSLDDFLKDITKKKDINIEILDGQEICDPFAPAICVTAEEIAELVKDLSVVVTC